eukprot:365607-Chlamydomonas_euryale.AAC.6
MNAGGSTASVPPLAALQPTRGAVAAAVARAAARAAAATAAGRAVAAVRSCSAAAPSPQRRLARPHTFCVAGLCSGHRHPCGRGPRRRTPITSTAAADSACPGGSFLLLVARAAIPQRAAGVQCRRVLVGLVREEQLRCRLARSLRPSRKHTASAAQVGLAPRAVPRLSISAVPGGPSLSAPDDSLRSGTSTRAASTPRSNSRCPRSNI